jgi:hypothetical protein
LILGLCPDRSSTSAKQEIGLPDTANIISPQLRTLAAWLLATVLLTLNTCVLNQMAQEKCLKRIPTEAVEHLVDI